MFISFFFFSSRRRHTRFDCDWSSDVCSSDLDQGARPGPGVAHALRSQRSGADAVKGLVRMKPLGALQVRIPGRQTPARSGIRSEEHTSELQSQSNLVCRLLLEKKKYGPPNTRVSDCRLDVVSFPAYVRAPHTRQRRPTAVGLMRSRHSSPASIRTAHADTAVTQ